MIEKALLEVLKGMAARIAKLEEAKAVEVKIGADGKDGADGVGLAGALIDNEGNLVVTTTKGETLKLGKVVGKDGADGEDGSDGADGRDGADGIDGKDGVDGVDGKGLEDVDLEYNPDLHEIKMTLAFGGGRTRSISYPAGGISHGGYWRDGVEARAGQAWTREGHLWIAKRDTRSRPESGSEDWHLAVRRGRDATGQGVQVSK